MGIFDFFRRNKTREETEVDSSIISDPVLRALLSDDEVDRETAIGIPAVSACVNRIADTVASLQVKLYRRTDDRVEEVAGDARVRLLNDDTGDTLDGAQFKKSMVADMYLGKGGYAYVHKIGGGVQSLHYVPERYVSFLRGTDPIFKDYRIMVNGKIYEGWQFVKLLRNTENGYCGSSIVTENRTLLGTVYASMLYERTLVKTGGNKKGFVQSARRLTRPAIDLLKESFRNLYSNNSENVVVLNEGLSFKESSNTSVEMQMNENKKTNSGDICKMFLVPPSILEGGAPEEDKKLYYEGCILPILERFSTALDQVLLREDEKDTLFFSFDTTDLLKGDIEKRFRAYEIACKNGFMQLDEVRKSEKLPAFGLDFIKLGLQDVLYYPKTDEIYTPNTNKFSKAGKMDAEDEPKEPEPEQNQKEGGDIE